MKIATLLSLVSCLAGAMAFTPAKAQVYPSRSIRMVVPFAPGGATDIVARIVAESMKDTLKQVVIVDNVPGASGGIGAQAVSNAAPDGYTFMVMANGMLAAPLTVKAFENFDPRTALTPIAYLAEGPILAFVNASFPARNFKEFIDYVKSNPGKFNYGASGGSVDLDIALFMSKAGLNMVKISYKGSAPMIMAGVQNEIQFGTAAPLTVRGQIEGGKLRAIGVLSGRPWPGDPSLHVASELVPGYAMVPGWYGAMGPKGLPANIVDVLAKASRFAVNQPSSKKRLEDAGIYILDGGPEEMAKNVHSTLETWREGVRITGTKPE